MDVGSEHVRFDAFDEVDQGGVGGVGEYYVMGIRHASLHRGCMDVSERKRSSRMWSTFFNISFALRPPRSATPPPPERTLDNRE